MIVGAVRNMIGGKVGVIVRRDECRDWVVEFPAPNRVRNLFAFDESDLLAGGES